MKTYSAKIQQELHKAGYCVQTKHEGGRKSFSLVDTKSKESMMESVWLGVLIQKAAKEFGL